MTIEISKSKIQREKRLKKKKKRTDYSKTMGRLQKV